MNCHRCHGLMVEERFEDLRGDPHHISFHGWRCVCCGDIVDPVIMRHRVAGPPATRSILAACGAARPAPRHRFPELDLEQPAA